MSTIKEREESFIVAKTKEFIRTEMEQQYSFEVEEGYAQNTIHRMRVELSRMRKEVKRRGKKPKPFKMLVVSIEKLEKRPEDIVAQERVTLLKTQNARQRISELLPELEADNHG